MSKKFNKHGRTHRSTVRHSCINMKIIYNGVTMELIFETYCFQSGSSTADLYARKLDAKIMYIYITPDFSKSSTRQEV